MKTIKKSKYFKDGYQNPIRCAEMIVKVGTQEKWALEMSEGIKAAQIDRSNNNYNPMKF